MANIGKLTAHIGADTSRLRGDLGRGSKMFRGFGSTIKRAIVPLIGMTAAIVGAAGLIKALKSVTTVGAQFEQSIVRAGAVMRATEGEIKSLTAAARKMGAETEWTASQAAESLTFLGMAGFNTAKAIKALPGTLDLATAANIDLGRAADIATNALTAMGLPVEELSRVNDVFVGTITRSNVNMEMLADSFRYAAPLANAMGYSVEELSGIIGMLGNAGIQGSMAGTQLAQAFLKSNDVALKFGFTSSDLIDVLDDLRKKGFSASQVIKIFGNRAGRAAGILFNATKQTKEFQKTLTETADEAKTLADKMRTTLIGVYKELMSTIEGVKLELFNLYKTGLRNAITDTTKLIRENKNEIIAFVGVIKESITETIRFFGMLKTAYEPVADLFEKINKYNPVRLLKSLLPEKGMAETIEIVTISEEGIAGAVQKLRDMKAALDGNVEAAERLGHTSKDVSASIDSIGESAGRTTSAYEKYLDTLRSTSSVQLDRTPRGYDPFDPAFVFDPNAEAKRMDRMVQLYRDLAASGRATVGELRSLWSDYSRMRGIQIEAEGKQLLAMGVSADIVAATMADRHRELNDEMKDIFGEQKSWMEQWAEDTADVMQNAFGNTFFDWMEGRVEGIRGLLLGITKEFLSAMNRMIAQAAAAKIVGAIFGSGGGGMPKFPVPELAAAGGMVTRPTLAMVGEAGPEMIIPLDKMRDPKFWSDLTGNDGQGDVYLTQNIQTPNPSAFQDSQAQIATQLAGAMQAARRNM